VMKTPDAAVLNPGLPAVEVPSPKSVSLKLNACPYPAGNCSGVGGYTFRVRAHNGGGGVDRIRVQRQRAAATLQTMLQVSGRPANACNVTPGRTLRSIFRGRRRSLIAVSVFTRPGIRRIGIACWRARREEAVRRLKIVFILAGRASRSVPRSTFCFCSGFRMDFGIGLGTEKPG